MAENKIAILATVLLAFLSGRGLFADQLVTNGGFETGDFSGWTLSGIATVAPPISYGVDATDADTGNYGAFFSSSFGPNNLILSQNLSVVPGSSYFVNFSLFNGVSYGGVYPNGFKVTFAGQTLFSETNVAYIGQPFVDYSYLVIIPASGSATAPLAFTSYADAGRFSLDNVSVTTASPEPAMFLLIAPVLGGLALWRRKRTAVGI